MSVVQQLEVLLINNKQTQKIEQFQQQYSQCVRDGLVHRKGYNLAGINVIGDKAPSAKNLNVSTVASAYNEGASHPRP